MIESYKHCSPKNTLGNNSNYSSQSSMKTAVIYARYSSDKQTEQSIEGQLRVCNDYAEKNNILVVDTYIDRAMTGKNDNRKAFQQMLKDSNKKAWDYVIAYKTDRIGRNKFELAMNKHTLKLNGVKFLSAMENIPDTPEGIILESLLEGMAEYYSADLAQKVRRGQNESRQKGQFTGGQIVYGYKVKDKKIYIDEDEAKFVRWIFERFASGIYVKDIMNKLNEDGILNHGRRFARNTIYHILHNEKYSGILRHENEIFTNIYPRTVSQDIFDVVKKRCDENKYGKHNDVVYLLKNKLLCGYCGKTIASESGTSKSGKILRYYKCTNRKHNAACKKKSIRKDILEQVVIDTTLKIFNNSTNINFIAYKILKVHKKRIENESKLNLLIQENNEKQKAIDNLISCMEKGIVTNSTKKRIEELENSISKINEKIEMEKSKKKLELTREDIIKYITKAIKQNPKMLIKLLIKNIVLFDDKIEITYNYVDNKQFTQEEHNPIELMKDTFDTTIEEHKIKKEEVPLHLDIQTYI